MLKVSEPLKYKSQPQQQLIPAEQATASMVKPDQQLSVRIKVKQLTATLRPSHSIQTTHFKKTPTSKPSLLLPDYHVFRQGGMLCIVNRVTGKRERASTLGPKWSVIKHQFFEVEDQAESEANGKESEIQMTPPQKVDQPTVVVQQLKLAEHAEVSTKQLNEPAKQPDKPAKRSTCTTSVSAEQPSIENQPKRLPTIPGPHYGDELTQANHKKLMKIIIPTKPIRIRKLPNFKKPITALKHEWKSTIAKGLPVQCHNYEKCQFQCASATDMEYHYMKCGTDTIVYTCKCGRFYANKGTFERHAYVCCEVYKCSHCGKAFHNLSYLFNHTAQCQMVSSSKLKKALAGIKEKIRFHTCAVCRDVFVSTDHFSRHQIIVHSSPSSITTGTTTAAPLAPVTTAAIVMESVTMESTATMTTGTTAPMATNKSSSNDTTTITSIASSVMTTTSMKSSVTHNTPAAHVSTSDTGFVLLEQNRFKSIDSNKAPSGESSVTRELSRKNSVAVDGIILSGSGHRCAIPHQARWQRSYDLGKFCGCQFTSVRGIQQCYKQCGTITCPRCDQTFTTTMRKFHPHYMNNHNGQVEASGSRNTTLSLSDGVVVEAEENIIDSQCHDVESEVIDVGDGNEIVYQHGIAQADNQIDKITEQNNQVNKVNGKYDQYHADQGNRDEVAKIVNQDDLNDQDDDNQMDWTASNHHYQRQYVTTEGLLCSWSWLPPGNKKLFSVSSARTRPIQKHSRIRQAQLKAVKAIRRQTELTQTKKKLAQEKQAQRELAKEKQALAKEKQALAKEKRAQAKEKLAQAKEKRALAKEKRAQERLSREKIVKIQEKLKITHQNLAQQRLTQRLVQLQKKLAQEREEIIQAQEIRGRKKQSEIKSVEEAAAQEGIAIAQEEVTGEIPFQPHSPDDVFYPLAMPAQPTSVLFTTQQQSTVNSVRLQPTNQVDIDETNLLKDSAGKDADVDNAVARQSSSTSETASRLNTQATSSKCRARVQELAQNKLSKTIHDHWAQIRVNTPSARAEAFAFSNNSPVTEYPVSGLVNDTLSLSDSVVVQTKRNTWEGQNHTAEVADLGNRNELIFQDSQAQTDEDMDQNNQIDEVIDQNDQDQVYVFVDQNDQDLADKFIDQNQVVETIFQDEHSDQDDDGLMFLAASDHYCQRQNITQDRVVEAIFQDDINQMFSTSSNHTIAVEIFPLIEENKAQQMRAQEKLSQQKLMQERDKIIQENKVHEIRAQQKLALSQERDKIIQEIKAQEMRVQEDLAQLKLTHYRLAQLQQKPAQQSLIQQNITQQKLAESQGNKARGQEKQVVEEVSAGEVMTKTQELTMAPIQPHPSICIPYPSAAPTRVLPTSQQQSARNSVRLLPEGSSNQVDKDVTSISAGKVQKQLIQLQNREQIRKCHEITKLSKQIQDQWAQLRSNTASARAERERAVLAFSNSSLKSKNSVSGSNTSMSLSDAVLVRAERNINDSQNHTTEVTYVSDGDSQNELDEVIDQNNEDQIVEHSNQDDQEEVISEYSSGTCPPQKHAMNYRIRQTQHEEQAEEAGSKKSIMVSTACTRLCRKHSTNIRVRKACLQGIWKQQVDEKLAQKKCTEENKARKILGREKQVQERLFRRMFQAHEIIAQKKLSETKLVEEELLYDEISQVMTKAQEESTVETSIRL